VGARSARKKSGGLILEVDEMWSLVGSKRSTRWVWVALDARTRRVVAMRVGDGSEVTARCLRGALPGDYRGGAAVYSGFYAAYRPVVTGADQPSEAVPVHGEAAVRPIRARDAVLLQVRHEPRRRPVVLRPPPRVRHGPRFAGNSLNRTAGGRDSMCSEAWQRILRRQAPIDCFPDPVKI
jgi:hypothetical protein